MITCEDDAPDVFDPTVPPGGWVCGACGMPTESEPCRTHQPHIWRRDFGLCDVTVQVTAAPLRYCGEERPCPQHDCVCAHCGAEIMQVPSQGQQWVHMGTRSRRCAGADSRTEVEPMVMWGWE